MTPKKCLVLLCTYNGEQYLRCQLDSVLSQTGVETHIRCADDRSTDGTVAILEEYRERYPDRFAYTVNEQNKRFTYNFLDLFFSTADTDYDYYAFCDQDDYWLPEKVSAAMAKIEAAEPHPNGVFYCSNLTVTDEDLRPLGLQEDPRMLRRTTTATVKCENIATGCTVVMDAAFHRHALRHYPQGILLHDFWLFLIAVFTARAIYDKNAYILYRQHGTNQIGTNKKKFSFAGLRKFSRMKSKYPALMRELVAGYGDLIPAEDLRDIETIRDYRQKFGCRMKLLFCRRFRRRSAKLTLILKVEILTGKF